MHGRGYGRQHGLLGYRGLNDGRRRINLRYRDRNRSLRTDHYRRWQRRGVLRPYGNVDYSGRNYCTGGESYQDLGVHATLLPTH